MEKYIGKLKKDLNGETVVVHPVTSAKAVYTTDDESETVLDIINSLTSKITELEQRVAALTSRPGEDETL